MSPPRVFISLGRTGQVVERGRKASNSREARCDAGPRSESKRSLGDGLRIYPHDLFISSKRQRGDGTYWGVRENRVDEMGLTPNDLRLKLLRRRSKRNQNVVKSARPSPSNGRFKPKPETRVNFHRRQLSYTKNADLIHLGDSVQPLNTSKKLNDAGSSDILLNSSGRTVAPLTNYDGRQRFSSISTTDVLTAKSFGRNGILYASMPTGFAPTTFKGSNAENAKQGEVPPTVSGVLHSLGLEKYEIVFRVEEIDMTALKQMGDKDLKDLGIPMGPRKKILQSLWPRSKQQPPRVHNFK